MTKNTVKTLLEFYQVQCCSHFPEELIQGPDHPLVKNLIQISNLLIYCELYSILYYICIFLFSFYFSYLEPKFVKTHSGSQPTSSKELLQVPKNYYSHVCILSYCTLFHICWSMYSKLFFIFQPRRQKEGKKKTHQPSSGRIHHQLSFAWYSEEEIQF